MNRYLTIGINNYRSAPLSGCVNDALDWTEKFQSRGYSGTTLLNEAAAKINILNAFKDEVARLKYGDQLVVQYSGHGSWIPDRDGDEPDGRDEVWCAHDYQNGGLITDDELFWIHSQRKFGTRVIILSDSCFSGSVSRMMGSPAHVASQSAARFMPPGNFLEGTELQRARAAEGTPARGTPRRGTALISGCSDTEYSYDAYINGRYNGAFTWSALQALKTYNVTNLKLWHEAIRRHYLPTTDWDQSPQLQATWWQKSRWMI